MGRVPNCHYGLRLGGSSYQSSCLLDLVCQFMLGTYPQDHEPTQPSRSSEAFTDESSVRRFWDNSSRVVFWSVSTQDSINGDGAFLSLFNGYGPFLSFSFASSARSRRRGSLATSDMRRQRGVSVVYRSNTPASHLHKRRLHCSRIRMLSKLA